MTNPYEPIDAVAEDCHKERASARALLLVPAVIMTFYGALMTTALATGLAASLFTPLPEELNPFLYPAPIILWSGISILRLKSVWLTYLGAMLFVTCPAGIFLSCWVVVVMLDHRVSDAFDA